METSPDTSPVPLTFSVILRQCQQRTAKRIGEEARPNYMQNHRTLYSLDNPLSVTFDEFHLYMMGECHLKIMEMAHVHRIINIYEKTL